MHFPSYSGKRSRERMLFSNIILSFVNIVALQRYSTF